MTVADDLPILDEPTAEEIADAAADEAKAAEEAARALQSVPDVPTTVATRRGPGRPPGAKNKKNIDAAARDRGKKPVQAQRPDSPPARPDKTEAEREAAAKKRDEHKKLVNAYVKEAMEQAPKLVKVIGLATGLPEQYLVAPLVNEGGVAVPGPDGDPVLALTPYGQALAPQKWQVTAAVEAGVRVMESEQGERLIEIWEKVAPYVYGGMALGGLGLYTITVLKTVEAIKPMIAQQIAEAAAQQAPGGPSAEPAG